MSQDFKFCPKCGTERQENQNFCPNCGYSYDNPQPEKQPNKIGEFFKKAIAWCKSHLKIVIPVAVAVLLAITLAIAIPVYFTTRNNGTYYKIGSNGEIDKTSCIIIKSGKWEAVDGGHGTYKFDGDNISMYLEVFGSDLLIWKGTVSSGVLTVESAGIKSVYVSEKHRHIYSRWETQNEVSCANDGLQTRSCTCGVKETQSTEKLPHTLSSTWTFDDDNHWKICSVCNQICDSSAHSDKNNCVVCGYPFFEYQSGSNYYFLTGLIDKNSTVANIPSTYKGKPIYVISPNAFKDCSELTSVTISDNVNTIAYYAFAHCSKLTSITIPNSIISIGENAFYGCSSLKDINFMGTKAQWNAKCKSTAWDTKWDYGTPNYTVHCTDGDIAKS